MLSLRDVARHAGVSVATASRVASGSAAVRPETRERVERAMRELLYVPPRRRRATGAIGLLVPELGNPIFPALAEEMERRATEAGFATILCNTAGSPLREADYVHMLLERRVDGMIFISSEVTDVRSRARRTTAAARARARGSCSSTAARRGSTSRRSASTSAPPGSLATEHLLELGHTRIGFAAGDAFSSPTREKAEGREARAAGGRASRRTGSSRTRAFTVEGGRRGASGALVAKRAARPTGIICSNDLMAIGVIREAEAHGV